ncbi:MAG TPA: riboflavin synthase, partial [Tepidisphaeraceae bacterium]|nr:riboflavin synthase [Tepidisphaeraceae bacterium]
MTSLFDRKLAISLATIPAMFTGVIEESLALAGVDVIVAGRRLWIDAPWDDVALGESIALNGACLTISTLGEVIGIGVKRIGFDVVPETLAKTNLGRLVPGDRMHVERAMKIGSRFDGHFVLGHVDGLAKLIEQKSDTNEWRLIGEVDEASAKYLVPKGSICLDGISLTLAKVEGRSFEIALIPTTLERTEFAKRKPGWMMNVEFDVIVKTVVNVMEMKE